MVNKEENIKELKKQIKTSQRQRKTTNTLIKFCLDNFFEKLERKHQERREQVEKLINQLESHGKL